MRVEMKNCNFPGYVTYILLGFLVIMFISCKKTYSPRPRGYFRIEFPEKHYMKFKSDCNFSFEIPTYGEVSPVKESYAEPCWYNVIFKDYNACFYLTFKPLNNNLPQHIEDIRTIVYKHSIKADDIIESPIDYPEKSVYGILYDIKGNTASSVNFYITDSVSGFLSGALYFNVKPNKDSLAPAIDFFREDIVYLIKTFDWR
jgi:gliding motility-associated lipoprotein GldD